MNVHPLYCFGYKLLSSGWDHLSVKEPPQVYFCKPQKPYTAKVELFS